jgi:molybdate transport system substrate-binding protein
MDELAEVFKSQHPGVEYQMTYQGSGALLAQIELTKTGDLYVAGDEFFMKTALDKKLVTETKQVAVFTPVLAVPKGNPATLAGFLDLAKPGIRLGMGDEKVAAVGHASRAYLERLGIRAQVEKNVIASTTTVDQLAVQCASGNLDAAIIWDSTAWQFRDKLDVVAKGDAESGVGVPIGVVSGTKNGDLARAFVDFAASQEAAPIYEKYGIVPATRER